MSAYVVMLRENTKDLAEMSLYEKEAPLARSGHDITPLVKYGALKVLEGSSFEGCLIHRFPSVEAAEAWYQSPKYQAAMKHRHKGANYRVFIVEGVVD